MKIASFDLGMRNLAWCVLERDGPCAWPPKGARVLSWKLVDISEGKVDDLQGADISQCVEMLIHTLKAHAAELVVDHVFLELQPTSRMGVSNIKTKVLSHICQGYFYEHGIPVTFVSPKLKNSVPCDEVVEGTPAQMYAARKKHAIASTGVALAALDDKEWIAWWAHRKGKKDDLADAFLQGLFGKPHEKKDKKVKAKRAKKESIIPVPSIEDFELE